MKKVINAIVMLMALTLLIQAQPKLAHYKEAENNYLKGLKSEIPGIRLASITYLGEMKSERAIGYLEDILEDSDSHNEKVAAANSLLNIGTDDSIETLQDFIAECKDNSFKEECQTLYNKFMENSITQNSSSN